MNFTVADINRYIRRHEETFQVAEGGYRLQWIDFREQQNCIDVTGEWRAEPIDRPDERRSIHYPATIYGFDGLAGSSKAIAVALDKRDRALARARGQCRAGGVEWRVVDLTTEGLSVAVCETASIQIRDFCGHLVAPLRQFRGWVDEAIDQVLKQ